MLKNTDKYDENAQFRQPEEYRKRPRRGANKDLTVFASVFVIGVLIILGFVKILSPNVDVTISNENEIASNYDEETNTSVIDERLKHLQMEDDGKFNSNDDMFTPELDERVILPRQMVKTVGEMEAELLNKNETSEKLNSDQQNKDTQVSKPEFPQPKQENKTEPVPQQATVNAKVVVGYYATEKQAEVAKSIINDAGLSVTPVVKNLGGYYTLQVGSYTSRERAQQAANNLLKSNFPARVIVE